MRRLLVSPGISMMDHEISIVAHDLQPGREYSLHLSLTHQNGTHESSAEFRSDRNGVIDLSKQAPIRGSYSEVESMGLFMSMVPVKGYRRGSPVVAVPTSKPFIYTLSLSDESGTNLDTTSITRCFEHPGIERIEIETDTVTGTIYKPRHSSRPLPAVIDLYGGSGGIKEHRAALMASRGFAVLCLAYFQYKKLPKRLTDIDLDYFQGAIEYFCSLPYTTDTCGMIGTSLGAVIACLMAIRNKRVKAIVPINGIPVIDSGFQIREHGVLLPFVPMEEFREMRIKNGLPTFKSTQEALPYEADMVFPIEKSAKDTKFYFITSIDDDSNTSVAAGRFLCDRLRQSGHWFDMDIVWGGHLIDPPYMPLVNEIYYKMFDLLNLFGGEPWGNAVSQRHTWQKTIDFFSTNIGEPAVMEPISSPHSKL